MDDETPTTYEQVQQRINAAITHRPYNLRPGQAAYNALHAFDPELANLITGTRADPFYKGANFGLFWQAIARKYPE